MLNKNSSGFTFLEMIVATAIVGMMITGLLAFERLLSDSQNFILISSQSFTEANVGVEAMVKELRNAKYADNGAYPLELADDQEIIFYANVDDELDAERVRYFLEDNELKKGVIKATGDTPEYLEENEDITLVIAYVQNQSNPIFYYYNGDWPGDTVNNPLPSPTRLVETKLMQVVLTINPRPVRPESQFTIKSFAQIRNLKTNL